MVSTCRKNLICLLCMCAPLQVLHTCCVRCSRFWQRIGTFNIGTEMSALFVVNMVMVVLFVVAAAPLFFFFSFLRGEGWRGWGHALKPASQSTCSHAVLPMHTNIQGSLRIAAHSLEVRAEGRQTVGRPSAGDDPALLPSHSGALCFFRTLCTMPPTD